MIFESLSVGSMQVNCYILAAAEGGSAIIIDPGADARKIKNILARHKLKPAFIINTHGHYDHIGADDEFGVPVYAHEDDVLLLRDAKLNLSNFLFSSYSVRSEIRALKDKENIRLDGIELEVIHTPGHTPGGICLLMKKPQDKILFSGDSLFAGSIGRTDFPGADERRLINSIKDKLLKLSEDTLVYPGHGASSTIGEEKINNPFLR